jgi:hypothetical protein
MGVDKAFNFDNNMNRISAETKNSSKSTSLSLGFEAGTTRRLVDSGPNLWIFSVAPSIRYYLTAPFGTERSTEIEFRYGLLNASLALQLSYRLHDEFAGFKRRDFLTSAVLTLEYVIPTSVFGGGFERDMLRRKEELGSPTINFQVAFSKLSSNKTDARYHQRWLIGPMLSAAWPF